jgi:hypothetical protein
MYHVSTPCAIQLSMRASRHKCNTAHREKRTAVNDHPDHRPLFVSTPARAPLLFPQESTIRSEPVYGKCSGRLSDAVTGAA